MKTEQGFYKFDIQLFAGETVTVGSTTTEPAVYEDYAFENQDDGQGTEIYLVSYTDTVATLAVYADGPLLGNTPTVGLETPASVLLDSATFSSRSWYSVSVTGLTGGTEYKVYSSAEYDSETVKPVITFTTTASASTWTVSFDSNGGTAVSDIEDVEDGATISAPTAPTRTNYTFAGWFTDDGTFADQWVFASDTVTADTTLYAKWVQGAFEKLQEFGRRVVERTNNIPTTAGDVNAEPEFTKNTAFNKNFGSTEDTVTEGDDPRLSDARPASDVYAWAKETTKPTYTKSEVGLSNADNTTDADKPISTLQAAGLFLKVDKEAGKGLSTNDFTNDYKTQLDNLPENLPETKILTVMDTSAPVGSDGDFYYNTTEKVIYEYQTDTWVSLGAPSNNIFYLYDGASYAWDSADLMELANVDLGPYLKKLFTEYTEKITPIGDDRIIINDSNSSWDIKRTTISALSLSATQITYNSGTVSSELADINATLLELLE